MRWTLGAVVSAAVLIAIVGCSSSPSASSSPAGATQPPGGATSTPGGATQAPGGPTGTECAAYPTFSVDNPALPSFAPDTDLQAKFPTQIDGQPVSELETGFWAQFMCFGGQAAYDQAMADMPAGFTWASMSYGNATYNVEGEDAKLMAFRSPGQDANGIVQALAQVAAALGSTEPIGTLGTANVAGKNVITLTDTDGTVGYGYVSGDTLFTIESGATDSQVAKILAALP